jgi:hypothetical protein
MNGQAATVSTDSMRRMTTGDLSRQARGTSATSPYSQAKSNHGLDPICHSRGQAEKTNALSTNRNERESTPPFNGSDKEEALPGDELSIIIEVRGRRAPSA